MEGERRRRGRRRDRKREEPSPPQEQKSQEPPEIGEESEAPGVLPSRPRFWRRSGRERRRKREKGKQEEPTPPAAKPVSPLAFWRRGRPRSFREQPRGGGGGFSRRLTGLYHAPWLPVAFIMALVGAIFFGVFVYRQIGAVGPLARQDHWHANYEIFICGQKQPVVPEFEDPEGVHTHADGLIHMHPFIPSGEGAGARLARWFEYGGDALGTGAELSDDTLQVPGDFEEYKNGDLCESGEFEGEPGVVQVFVNQEPKEDFDRYIPQDGDFIRIVFAPEGKLPSGTVFVGTPAPIGEVDRTVAVEASDRGSPEVDSFFDPDSISINADERVKFDVTNTGSVSHNLRIAGLDQEYKTEDDFVSDPVIITPGETGTLVEEIEEAGTYAFRCDIHPKVQFGTLTVEEAESASPTPTPEGG